MHEWLDIELFVVGKEGLGRHIKVTSVNAPFPEKEPRRWPLGEKLKKEQRREAQKSFPVGTHGKGGVDDQLPQHESSLICGGPMEKGNTKGAQAKPMEAIARTGKKNEGKTALMRTKVKNAPCVPVTNKVLGSGNQRMGSVGREEKKKKGNQDTLKIKDLLLGVKGTYLVRERWGDSQENRVQTLR